MRGKRQRHHFRQLIEATLADRVGHLIRNGDHRIDARHVDDDAAVAVFARRLRDHAARCGLPAQKRTFQVDAQHAVEILFCQIQKLGAVNDAGIVDHDVDAPELRDGPLDQRRAVARRADVGSLKDRGATRLDDLIDQRQTVCFVDVGHRDLGALRGEQARACGADSLRGAGDDSYPLSKLHRFPVAV